MNSLYTFSIGYLVECHTHNKYFVTRLIAQLNRTEKELINHISQTFIVKKRSENVI